jgi:protein required for attachment to host cells
MRKSGLPQGAWVLIADGEKALILSNHGDEIDMNLVVERTREQDNPAARDWATDRPGRFNDGPSVHRSAVQNTDWHQLEKERFADDLARLLQRSALEGAFDHLAIVASRVVLAELRAKLHEDVTRRIVLEVPKVLTNHPVDEIEMHLTRELQNA